MEFVKHNEEDNLGDLKFYINNVLHESNRKKFNEVYIPFIEFLSNSFSISEINTHINNNINNVENVSISRLQCASLIAKCFLNKIQPVESNEDGYRSKTFIDIFNKPISSSIDVIDVIDGDESHHDYIIRMLTSESFNNDDISSLHIEKIKFIMNYFHNIYKLYKEDIKTLTNEFVYFEKKKLTNELDFTVEKPLSKVKLTTEKIENYGHINSCEIAKVLFANKFIGGKVLSKGCCQEEIKFLTNPELLVGLILFNNIEDGEALVVDGTITFSDYTGYGFELMFKELDLGLGMNNLKKEYLIEIDAYRYTQYNKKLQYEIEYKNRDIVKAIIGFQNLDNRIHTIATGNWGCGAFNGDFKLKFLIQWYAASICGKDLVYSISSANSNQFQVLELTKLMEPLLFLTTKKLLSAIYEFNSR